MKLVVLGGSGRTGREVVALALAADHQVALLVRDPAKIPTRNPQLRLIKGDATDVGDLRAAFDGQDAAISCLGPTKGSDPHLSQITTAAIIAAASASGLRRVVILSAAMVDRARLTSAFRLITGLAMRRVIADKTAAEELLEHSQLDWTVVDASTLKKVAAADAARVVPTTERIGLRHQVSRTSVAKFMLDSVENSRYLKERVAVSG